MRFAVVAFAVLAVAYGQSQSSTTIKPNVYNPFGYQGQYQQGQYNPYNQYNRYNNRYQPYNQFQGQYQQGQYNPYNQYQNQYQNRYPFPTYKPFVSSTPVPVRPVEPVAASPAPAASAAPAATAAPATASASATVVAAPSPAPVPVQPVPVIAAKVISDARAASIVKYGNEINADGAYNYYYETDNGIAAQEQGTPRNFGGEPPVVPDVAQGSFSWTSPEGEVIAITYVADENGYQPQGNAIPQPPEIPPQIARALEYIAKYAPSRK